MAEKKIATGVKVLIRVADFENIEIAKYSETTIEYDSREDMVAKEEEHHSDVVDDLIRSMRELPDRLGKKTDAVVKVEEKIQDAIPQWLEDNLIPNLADNTNVAAKMQDSHEAKQKAKNSERESMVEDLDLDDSDASGADETSETVEAETTETNEETEKVAVAAGGSTDSDEEDDLFGDDDDLFS